MIFFVSDKIKYVFTETVRKTLYVFLKTVDDIKGNRLTPLPLPF